MRISVPGTGKPMKPGSRSPKRLLIVRSGPASVKPYASVKGAPVFCSKGARTYSCSGPAADMHIFSRPLSGYLARVSGGKSEMRLNKISAPQYMNPFGGLPSGKFNVAMLLIISSVGGGRGNSMIHPPHAMAKFMTPVIPNECWSGRTPTQPDFTPSAVDSGVSFWLTDQISHCLALAKQFSWVNIAAFGTPVVPPVMINVATSSSGLISTFGGFGAVFNVSSHFTAPG